MRRLTDDPAGDLWPTWSPDGSKIAFVSDRDGNAAIYVMNADGSDQTNLTDTPALDIDPAWSPDGSRIAFVSYRDGNYEVYVMNADGSDQTNLTNNTADDSDPAWSPDDAQIACQTHSSAITVRNADLTGRNVNLEGQTRSLMVRQFNQFPTWSPNGARIAFLADDGYPSGYTEICIINPDLSGLVRLADNEKGGTAPAWSPDGTKIAYITRQCTGLFQCGSAEIQVRNADGTGKIRLTYNDLEETELAWSPDGTRITFAASPAQTTTPEPGQPALPKGLFIINADGSAQIQLVAPASDNGGLSWQPIAP